MTNKDIGSWASGEPIPGTDIGALVSALEITAFLAAVNGPKGDLDAWLEVHDEKACRAIFKAAFSPISATKVQGAAPTDDPMPKRTAFIAWCKSRGLDTDADKDAWGALTFKYPHIESMWEGWFNAPTVTEPHALSVLRQISQRGSIGDDPEFQRLMDVYCDLFAESISPTAFGMYDKRRKEAELALYAYIDSRNTASVSAKLTGEGE